jgi:3-methylcrotonyl-CoA carboxylase alpha subunit
MKRKVILNGEPLEFEYADFGSNIEIFIGDETFNFQKKTKTEDQFILSLNNQNFKGEIASHGTQFQVFAGNLEAIIEIPKIKSKTVDHAAGPISPMPGKVFKVFVKVGDNVKKGDALMILEAMKMEHTIKANIEGVVKKVHFKEGDMVTGGVTLVDLGN